MRSRPVAVATVAVLALSGLAAPSAAATAPTDLFFSEYVEGTSNNKALEIFNGTGAAVDLAAGGYLVQMYFNGAATAGLTVELSGTVADRDVFVLAQAAASAAILGQADQTSGAGFFNGDDAVVLRRGGAAGPVLDAIGQVGTDPGTEWGAGLTSTADNTLRRSGAVTAGDTDPADPFDPAAGWVGHATDAFDGLGAHALDGGDQPPTLTCGPTLTTSAGVAATRTVTGTDPDDTIVALDAAVAPVPAAGTITRTAFTPAAGPGGTATAEITVDAAVPPGFYTVTVTSTDSDGTAATCAFTVQVSTVLTIGEVQGQTLDTEPGRTDRSPLAPPSGNGSSATRHDVRGVITQRTLARTASGGSQHGFFLQSRTGTEDGDPLTSDGIFVFTGGAPALPSTSLIGGYLPVVGDEVVLRARVAEFFFLTELTSASLVRVLDTGVTDVAVTDAVPPAGLAAADRFWERLEGTQLRVRAGSATTSGRDVFASTADAEVWLVDVADPLLDRADPYARRVFRDAHPLDGVPDGNGQRIMLGSLGLKAATGDSTAMLPPARLFDTLTADATGGLYFAFDKYGIQVRQASFAPGADPAANHPPRAADRREEVAVSTYNVENLYDYRDDPFDGCDFAGNPGCPGVAPPFDYVPASEAAYQEHLRTIAAQIAADLHAPDLLLVQEAEDQDICAVASGTVASGALACGTVDNADGKPDTLQELALTIAALGGPAYDAGYDRDGADDRGIVSAFLYRTDRLSLAAPTSVLTATPGVGYRAPGLPYNSDVQNPKALNAELPSDVDRSTGVDGEHVYTRAPQVARFTVLARPGGDESFPLWAVSNHFSSTPQARVGQRTEQAGYGAAVVAAIEGADPHARIVYGGDLNVFPRPDDPLVPPSDQLGPLYAAGLHNLFDDLVADAAAAAYSYVFQGQGQTLDHLWANDASYGDFVQMRSAHVNAGWPADHPGDGARGASDHDPQVALFRSRPRLSVADASVVEGDFGTVPLSFAVTVSRPLSRDVSVCAAAVDLTARFGQDHDGPLLSCATLAAGGTRLAFAVGVRGDRRAEPDETLALLVFADPRVSVADGFAVGTIINDD